MEISVSEKNISDCKYAIINCNREEGEGLIIKEFLLRLIGDYCFCPIEINLVQSSFLLPLIIIFLFRINKFYMESLI